MRATLYLNHMRNGDVSTHMKAMSAGLKRHGIDVHQYHDRPDLSADFAVVWGWRRGKMLRDTGFERPILVLERGYLGDRWQWTSMGWDGLNGRARFNVPQDRGERFWANYGGLAREWEAFDGYWLIIGQVIGDAALSMVDFNQWVKETADDLERLGKDVRFRPHPEAINRGQALPVPNYMVVGGTLSEALSEAACVVTWNSNTGVDAVLSGVPAVAYDEGAMGWPVASHSVHEPLVMPDRADWFRDMSWRQWSMEEIQSGEAWEVVRTAMQP